MQNFTNQRTPDTPSELWVVEHPPVYTQGQAGKAEHLLDPGDIPVIQTDRGGQVTYHGPGQIVIYLLLSLRETGLGVRALVSAMEHSLIQLLAQHGVTATADPKAPGVYVQGAKIAALGLRVRRGYTYHGLALNIDMDLHPFTRINPCGYPHLIVTQTKDQGIHATQTTLTDQLIEQLKTHLGYQRRRNRSDYISEQRRLRGYTLDNQVNPSSLCDPRRTS
jgi:lipoyl(octanoyl) transferase